MSSDSGRSSIPAGSIDPVYLTGSTYYLVPDGPAGQRLYAPVRQAIAEEKNAAIGRAVISQMKIESKPTDRCDSETQQAGESMQAPLPRRSFLAACAAPGTADLFGASPRAVGTSYLATQSEWGLRPGSGEDQSRALQRLIDAVAERGGGMIVLPGEHEGVSGSYLVQGIRPRDNVLLQGIHGATLQLPDRAATHLIDNAGEYNVSRFVLRGLILDGQGANQALVRIKRFGSSGYAWDLGGMYDVELRNAAIGAEVDWAGQVYYRGGRVQNCQIGLSLSREHLYVQDVTLWGCRTGILADRLLHTHWDHVVFAHGGPNSTAVRTPQEGGPHLQESRLVNCEVIDYRRGLDVRYLLDTQISGWRFKAIDFEGIRATFSGMVELSSCRFLGCGDDPSGEYSAVRIENSAAHSGWRVHGNLARDAKDVPTMKYGFDLSGLPNAADAVVGHSNFVRGSVRAGYLKRPGHSKMTDDQNVGTFATV